MKKVIRISLLVFILLLALPGELASADTPYHTWALGPGGYPILTQDAYSPVAEVDVPANAPEDMFIAPDGTFYIADTGGGRILKMRDFTVAATIGEGQLEGPTGVYVDNKGTLYVADGKKNEIFIFAPDGTLRTHFGRPSEPLYGKDREFLPRKLAVDARQNIYVVSEGSVDGVAQMNIDGHFIGYFASNASEMSLKMVLQRMFLTKQQLAQFVKNEAASPSNITIDNQSMVYTVTAGTSRYQAIRKFTISGKNIFPNTWGSTTLRDIDVSEDGLVLAVDGDGQMYEYNLNGSLLFYFGAKDTGDQRMGTLRNPSAVGRYQDRIYVLDKDKNALVVYQSTAFARTVHDGMRLYVNGFYQEAKPYFEQVLNLNGSLVISYQAIADAYFKEGKYQQALESYRYAESRDGYSQAFWELRNQALQKYLSPAILMIIGLTVFQSVGSGLERRHHWLDPVRGWFARLGQIKVVDDFVFMFRFIKQPADSFYYIKKKERGSLPFALGIYVWVVVVRILTLMTTSFIFNQYATSAEIPLANEILLTVGIIVLWNAANYLISTISDGEGRVRDVIIGSAYSLFPYALFALPIALLSNLLTYNEAFLYNFSMDIVWVWMGIMLVIMVMEIHNYSFSETVRNVLLTLFAMALFLLTGYILYVLFGQVFDFISTIVQEVGLRG